MENTATLEAPAALAGEPLSASNDSFGASLDAFFNNMEVPQTPVATPAAEITGTPDASSPTTPENPTEKLLDDVDDAKDWTPQAARRFKEIKAEAKASKAQLSELQSQLSQREARLAELEALANDPKVKDLTSRAAEYEQAMLLNDLENSNAYKTLVRAPLERITGEIDQLAEKYSISGDDLIDVVVMVDENAQEERLGELLANASDRDKFKLYKLIEETKPVLEQRRALQENAREAVHELRELEAQREQLTLVERTQQRTEAAKAVAKRIETKLPFLTTFEGLDIAALAKEAGETDYSRLDPTIGTYNAMAGKLLPKLASQYLAIQREVAHMAEKLAEYDRTGSPLNGGRPQSSPGGSRADSGKSFLEAVEAAFPR